VLKALYVLIVGLVLPRSVESFYPSSLGIDCSGSLFKAVIEIFIDVGATSVLGSVLVMLLL
jgi:hypothetical protein